MSKKFIEPSLGTRKGSSSKTFIYSSYSDDRIISPYDGEVVSTSDTECGGNIKLKHYFNGKIIYSNFCGVNRSNVLSGQNVYQSKPIGTFGDKELKFEVIDGNGSKQDINSLLKGSIDSKTFDKSEEKTSKKYGGTSTGIGSDLMKMVLGSPSWAAEKISKSAEIKKKPKPEEEPNDIVFEEIKRIKTLMK